MKVLRHLEPAAVVERDERARDYPGFVARQLVAAEDAQADHQAWCAIVHWTATGNPPLWRIEVSSETLARWSPERAATGEEGAPAPVPSSDREIMLLASAKALRHLDRQRAAAPDDAALAARRARVAAIRDGLAHDVEFYADLNRRLREQAAKRLSRQAAA